MTDTAPDQRAASIAFLTNAAHYFTQMANTPGAPSNVPLVANQLQMAAVLMAQDGATIVALQTRVAQQPAGTVAALAAISGMPTS